jgi:hypothetical protein
MAGPLVPSPDLDADLAGRDEDELLGIVARLTNEIDSAEAGLSAMRTRRVRAFRHLRVDHGTRRSVIAAAGNVTEGAIGNLIKDLEKREADTPTADA